MKKRLLALIMACVLLVPIMILPASAEEDEIYFDPAQIALGSQHTVALYRDGTVWCWGGNSFGALGNGSDINIDRPVQAVGLTNVIAVSAGDHFSLAMTSDGTVWSWGINTEGQLGNGNNNNQSVPVQVVGLTGVVEISAGYNSGFARKSDGTVWSWGSNGEGQLGNGSFQKSNVPVQVKNLSDIVQISAGHNMAFSVQADGTLWGWGYGWGQIFNSQGGNQIEPVQIQNIPAVKCVTAGWGKVFAITQTGALWGFGQSLDFYSGMNTPVELIMADVKQIEVGSAYAAVLKTDGTVWTWGSIYHGHPSGETDSFITTPTQIEGLSNITKLSDNFGSAHFCIMQKSDGTCWGWGANECGQVGDLSTTARYSPVQVFPGARGGTPVPSGLFVLLEEGETAQLSLKHDLSVNMDYAWSSSDPAVATVDANGVVTAVASGTCNITAQKDGFSESIPVKVISSGEIRLALHLTSGRSKNLWLHDDLAAVTWASSNPAIAAVDQTGRVTGVAQGLCQITGTLDGTDYTMYVRVNNA